MLSEAVRCHDKAKREWLSMPTPSWPTEKTYVEEIHQLLSAVTIASIASTLGISEPYAAEVRGRKMPPASEALATTSATR